MLVYLVTELVTCELPDRVWEVVLAYEEGFGTTTPKKLYLEH